MSENNLTGKRAALYIRVSTDEQARHGLSLDEQEYELKKYANEHGALIAGIYRDEGTTARKNLKKRKELQRLLSDVKADKIDVILFIKLDRWFRNIADYYKVQEILNAHEVDWVATKEQYNTTSSNGRFTLNIRLSVAQNESDQTSDRVKFIFEGKKRRREKVSGKLPFGYRVDKNKHIVWDKEKAKIVKDIFSYFLFSQSTIKTLLYANKHGYPCSKSALGVFLRNESYIGKFYGIENYTKGIIDLETWEKVKAVLQPRRIDTPRKPKQPYYFTGLIHCPKCNHRLKGYPLKSHYKQKVYVYKFYICPKHYQEKSCDFSLHLSEKKVEKYLLTNLQNLILEYQVSMQPMKEERDNSQLVKKLEMSLDRLKDLYVSGFIDRATYEKDFKKYNQQLQDAMQKHRPPKKSLSKELLDIAKHGIPAIYKKLSEENKRQFWHIIIKDIYITYYEKGRGGHIEYAIVFL